MRSLLLVLLIPLWSFAAENWDSQGQLSAEKRDFKTSLHQGSPKGWWPFFSTNLGLLSYSDERPVGDGHNLQTKGVLSFYDLTDFVYEGGLGLQASEAENSNTVSGVLEGASRYRFSDGWEAGPVINLFVGNGENYGSSNEDLTTFVGGHVLYGIPLDNGDLLRTGARLMTDVGIPGSTAHIFMFEVHYGLPFFQESKKTVEKNEPRPRTDHLAKRALKSHDWNPAPMAYSTRQVDLNSSARKRITKLAQALLAEKDLVESIRVIGHADQRGSTYANQMLSKVRAQSVANALILAGYPRGKIEVVAYGESRPLSYGEGAQSWEKNRRVELKFKGVSKLNELKSILQQVGLE